MITHHYHLRNISLWRQLKIGTPPEWSPCTYSQNVTIYEAQISLSNVSNYEEEDILPYMDAMESAASPTEVGCYENLNPDHEESFIKESEMTLAFFICGFEKEIKLQDDPSGQRLYFVDFYLWVPIFFLHGMLIMPDLQLPKQNKADIGTTKAK